MAGLVLGAGAASAATAACAVSYPTGTSLNFSSYNPFAAGPITASMSVTLTCTHTSGGAVTTTWTMDLSSGNSGNCANRTMTSGADALSYNIYINNLAGGIWGTPCSAVPGGTLMTTNGQPTAAVTYVLYGQLPAGQLNAGAGVYGDGPVLTVTWNP